MSDSQSTEAPLFEVLPGLPGVGPYPEQFTATGGGTHSEGLIVRFYPPTSSTWVGNFQLGRTQYNAVLIHPDARTLVVVAGGQGYHIDPNSRVVLRLLSDSICASAHDPTLELLILADDCCLGALDSKGVAWDTDRISWDGIRGLAIEGLSVSGESYDSTCDNWSPFSVDLLTGEVTGGSYRRSMQYGN